MALSNSSAALPFVRYPDAPDRSALTAYCYSGCMLSIRTGSLGLRLFRSFSTSRPPLPGMEMSSRTRSKSPSSTLSSASLPSDYSSTTMSSGLSAGARPTWPRLAPQSSHIGIEERTISLRSKPIDVYLITDLNQFIGQSTSKSLKYVLRSRMIILHRIHQKPEMTGERALLNVPHGEPKPSRAYLFVSLEIVPFTTDAFREV